MPIITETINSRTGRYDRQYCGAGDIPLEPRFMEFDPSRALGRQRWSQLMRLLKTRLRQPACKLAELRGVEELWLAHNQA